MGVGWSSPMLKKGRVKGLPPPWGNGWMNMGGMQAVIARWWYLVCKFWLLESVPLGVETQKLS